MASLPDNIRCKLVKIIAGIAGIDFHGKMVGVQQTPTLLIFRSPRKKNLGVRTFSTNQIIT